MAAQPDRVKYEFLIALAIFIHLADFFLFNFRITGTTIAARLLLYALLGFLTYNFCKPNMEIDIKEIVIWAAIPVFFIPIFSLMISLLKLSTSAVQTYTGFLLLVPVYLIYLMFIKGIRYPFWVKGDGIKNLGRIIFPSTWAKIYFIYLVWVAITTIIILFQGVIQEQGFETLTLNFNQGVKTVTPWLLETPGKVIDSIYKAFSSVQYTYQQYTNKTLGGYYTSRVEDTNKEKPGISITNFKPEGKYYEGNPNQPNINRITFSPRIIVKLFDENVSNIKLRCIAYDLNNKTRNVTGRIEGTDSITDTISIYKQDQRTVFCRFNEGSHNILTPGRYNVEFSAEFDYTTWAYSNYIFIDRDYLESLRASGEDPQEKFGIPKSIESIYTAGPAMVGMRRDMIGDLPIGLSTSLGDNNYVPIGITLDNQEKYSGQILNVNYFEVKIPKEFKLDSTRCSHSPSLLSFSEIPEYSSYLFKSTENNLMQTYLTIDCDMQASGLDARSLLGGVGGLSQATIAVKANYKYLLKSRMTITVEKDPVYRG